MSESISVGSIVSPAALRAAVFVSRITGLIITGQSAFFIIAFFCATSLSLLSIRKLNSSFFVLNSWSLYFSIAFLFNKFLPFKLLLLYFPKPLNQLCLFLIFFAHYSCIGSTLINLSRSNLYISPLSTGSRSISSRYWFHVITLLL